MGVRSGLISLVLGSLITAVHLWIFPIWLGWPAAVLWAGLWWERQQEKSFDLTWYMIGSFLPLYYAFL